MRRLLHLMERVPLFQLWHALHHALPRHPYRWYRLEDADSPIPLDQPAAPLWRQVLLALGFAVAVLTLLVIGWLSAAGVGGGLGIGWALLMSISLSYGVLIANGIAGRIAREQVRGRLALMGVTPSGRLAALWVIATRYLRGSSTVDRSAQLIANLHALWAFALIPLFFFGMLGLGSDGRFPRVSAAFQDMAAPANFVNGALLLALSRADVMYAGISAALVAMSTAGAGRVGGAEAGPGAAVAFGLLHVFSHLLVVLIGGIAQGLVFQSMGAEGWWLASLAFLLCFFVIREAGLYGACRLLAGRTDESVAAVRDVHQRGI